MKRIVDIIISLFSVIFLSPVFFAIWFVIVVGSGFPGFFVQRRIGRSMKSFSLYKFRTMTVKVHSEKGSFDAGRTNRVTNIGRTLRKWKLDELPQLWNVMKGDMSLVGPRPEVKKWVDVYPDRWARVLTVRPGITDPASIEFRNEEEILAQSDDPERTYLEQILPRKLDMYEGYVRNQCMLGDMKIIINTILAVAKK